MPRMRIGYIRVSGPDPHPERQLESIPLDKIFIDQISGKDVTRPQLEALRVFAREGDRVLIHSMDRLARDLDELCHLVREFTDRGVGVEFVQEQLTFAGAEVPVTQVQLSVMGACAAFARAVLRERQHESNALVRQDGVYRGRKKALSAEQAALLRQRAAAGEQKAKLAREFAISRETLYQYLRKADSDPV